MEGQSFERGRKKNVNVFLSNLSAQVATQRGERQTYTHINQAHPRFFFPTLVPSVFFYPLIHSITHTHTLTHTLGWHAVMESCGLAGLIPPLSTVIGRLLSDGRNNTHTQTHTQANNTHKEADLWMSFIFPDCPCSWSLFPHTGLFYQALCIMAKHVENTLSLSLSCLSALVPLTVLSPWSVCNCCIFAGLGWCDGLWGFVSVCRVAQGSNSKCRLPN